MKWRVILGLAWVIVVAVCGTVSAETGVRHVTYEGDTIVPVQTRLRFTTLIVLPEHEEILDWVCGDRDNWVISGAKNVTYIKPAQAGAHTDLHLVTTSGHIYSFLVSEVGVAKAEPDLRVIVDTSEASFPAAALTPRYYPAAQLEACRDELTRAQASAKQFEAKAGEAGSACRASYPGQLRFPYTFERGKKPFFVEAIFHDGRFTYVRLSAPELPALYEVQDGGPQLVPFEYRDGLLVIGKVLDGGYLGLGKQQLPFSRAEGH